MIDPTVVICLHNSTTYKDALTSVDDLLETVAELRKYFNRVFPVLKGGVTYPGVRLGMNGSREKLQDFTEYDLQARGIHL
eukprot:7834011-Ditylum_brightwellii.AAC.1